MNLDTQQAVAVSTNSKRALVIAGAGSGKTRVLVERVAYLVEKCKVSPSEIMCFTFTRKAAAEMRERLQERIGNAVFGLQLGTMHALALKTINRFGEVIGMKSREITVYSEWEEKFLLKEVAKEMMLHDGRKWKIPKVEVDAALDKYYQKGIEPDEKDPVRDLFKDFIQRCRENNSLTYGGLMIGLKLLVPTMSKYMNVKHILVDEVQDIDHLQWKIIIDMEALFGASLYVVGDVDQCQPKGTMVTAILSKGNARSATRFKFIPIEDLKDGDEVISWTKEDQRLYHVGRKIKVSNRRFSGRILSIVSGLNKTKMTGEHWVWARYNKKSLGQKVVYLMYREGFGFRVGTSQIRTDHGAISVNVRARLEKADKMWILKTCTSKKEADKLEQIIALHYQIPYCTFENNGSRTEADIAEIFNSVKDFCHGFECLTDHGRLWDFPLIEYPSDKLQKFNGYFKTAAANLLPGIMDLPTTKTNQSHPIDFIEWEDYTGYLYSLDVEHDHTYIADGIPVGNSIYEWRGAAPKYLVDHQEEFEIYPLETNYRSVPKIVEAANSLIDHNHDRITKTMVTSREPVPESVSVKRDYDSGALSSVLKALSTQTAVLARNHVLLKKLSGLLDDLKVPHTYIGRMRAVTENEQFRRFHAFLKLIVNPHDNFSFLLIKDLISLKKEDYTKIRLQAADIGKSHYQVYRDYNFPFPLFREYCCLSDAVMDLDNSFPELSPEAIAFVGEYLVDKRDNIQDYIDWLALYEVQDEIREDKEGLVLCTIHAAKGLEWPVVIVAGCNEGLIPSQQAMDSGEIEAERRLMYVAITRAKDQLVLAVRPETTVDIRGKEWKSPPSRFIEEAL